VVCLNGITELAKLFKERENASNYTPVIGKIIELPDIKIRLKDKVILTSFHIKSCINLLETDENGIYINLGKKVVLLPYADNQKFIVVGVVQ
jgi:hypothetical protein